MNYKEKLNKYYKNYLDDKLVKRLNSYIEDEPKTIKWIESFDSDSVFYDIGSNVGGFSVISAIAQPNVKVYSFEPNFINFYVQTYVCKTNKIKNVFPLNIAINDTKQFNYFKYDYTYKGSKGTFGTELRDQMLQSDYSNPFKRGINMEVGILGLSLDSLVYEFNMPKPNYIKIDVDGNDLLALKGAKLLLDDPALKEIFIEIDDKIYKNNEIEEWMDNYDFDKVENLNVGTNKKPMRMVLYKRR